jgi:hypothetical protein
MAKNIFAVFFTATHGKEHLCRVLCHKTWQRIKNVVANTWARANISRVFFAVCLVYKHGKGLCRVYFA